MAFPKPDDLRAETIRKAKKLFEAIDDAPSGFKTDTRKEVAEELGVEDKAFRWKKVVAPKFAKRGEDWPHYDDPKAAAKRLQAEYGEDEPEEEVVVVSKEKMADLVGAHRTTIWRAVRDDRSCKGHPVNEWAVTDSTGSIEEFEVPVETDLIDGSEENQQEESSEIEGGFADKVRKYDPQLGQVAEQHPEPVRRILEIVFPEKTFPASTSRQELLDLLEEEYRTSEQPSSGSATLASIIENVASGKSGESGPVREQSERSDYDAWRRELSAVEQGGDPDPSDLTEREKYIATKLQQGHTIEGLVDDLGTRKSVLKRHLKDLKRQGWSIYFDSSAEMVAIEGDTVLRSSEHKGTRTRKANRWWEMRHNELVRNYRGLEVPNAELNATPGREDWVTHLTDLHAGDKVRREDGTVVYKTEDIPDVIDYITEQSLALARHHNAKYDDAHVLWGGDMITGESIYSGQFEDLDAWLDEQLDVLVSPLIRQIKAFAEADEFDTVNIVTVVGNHGQSRASGTSRQANMDLILYKFIRNAIAEISEHAGMLDNVRFKIGQAEAFRNFEMRGGKVRGHLRHGQNRKPQAETSARKKAWQATWIDHDFDVAYMGHYHVTGRIPWNGPPILSTGSPKPAGEFVERIGESDPEGEYQNVATVHGVSDDGLTGVYPVDTRNYQ